MNIKEEIKNYLIENEDKQNAPFERRIVCTNKRVYGLKTKLVEDKAREMAKRNISVQDLSFDSYEEIMIAGMMIGHKKISSREKIEELKTILPYIDCWGLCDSIVPRLKKMEDQKEFFVSLLDSKKVFYIRVGIVWLMRYFLKNDLKNTIFLIKNVKNDDYYVKMAQSWTYAEAFIYDFNFMLDLVKKEKDKFIQKKTISKAIESYRISETQKQTLRDLREGLKRVEV